MVAQRKLTGQYKWSFETGQISIVGSKATERPIKEKQGNLLSWGEEQTKLARWIRASTRAGPQPAS
jgi:hypothetical protein